MSAGSFTQRLLAELSPHLPPLACCRAAFVQGMTDAGDGEIVTTRLVAARAALQALHQCGVAAHVERLGTARHANYRVGPTEIAAAAGEASARSCCARSRLRGAFMTAGRVNRPDASPHLEIDCRTATGAAALAAAAAGLGIDVQMAERRGHHLVLARSADSVAAVLSSIGAQTGRLEYEDGRVVREVRGGVNRRLNAETANLRRTVGAGMRQVAAVHQLMADRPRWESLPAALREAAAIRTRLPGESLERLAKEAGCSRSAMAGRLHRIVVLAEGLAG